MISDNARSGMQQAPARSLFNALGFTAEELKKPMVGIVSSYNEIVPGHMNIDKIVNAVKLGVAEAGGVPVVFPAIAVCDGIAMGHVGMKYSLVTRDLIADSTECMAIAHQFDALVMVPNCDKNVPGLLMAAARLNLPTVFVSGGPMLAGHVQGKKRSLSSMFEAVGSYAAGTMTEDDVLEYENKVCPTCGSCSGMYTANSMNCLTEALGMGLRGNGTIPAVYSERIKLAKHAGMAVMDMFRNPKAAAYVYASQGNKNDVLYVTSSVEIGDHPSCTVGDFYVLTNADSVRLYKNEQMIREYTHADSPFTNMVNPPILINDRVGNLLETNEGLPHETSEALKQLMFAMVDEGGADGNLSAALRLKRNFIMKTSGLTLKDISRMYNTYVGNWGDLATTYRFEAVKNGEVVAVVKKQPMTSADFIVKIDKTKLVEASTYDVASIRMEAVDENGNRLYYCNAPVELSVEGPVEIIGPCVVPFIGGAAGTYVKTTGQSGSGKLTIKSLGKTYSIELDVK